MSNAYAFIKFIIFGLLCLVYALGSLTILTVSQISHKQNKEKTRESLIDWISFMSRLTLKLLGINILRHFESDIELNNNYFLASNHMSYLDVLIIAGFWPSAFVTSFEAKEMPFLGALTELGGCLYVERRNKSNLHNEIAELTRALDHGMSVAVFPEATSTNGTSVLRFRRPLFQAAIDSETDVLPITINYVSLNSNKINEDNRDIVCWYGDMEFLSHFWVLLKQRHINVDLFISKPIPIIDQKTESLSVLTHQEVCKQFQPFKSSSEILTASFSQDLLPETLRLLD